MLNQEYIFKLLENKNIHNLSELSRVLGVKYTTLRYGFCTGNISLKLANCLADFLSISIDDLLSSDVKKYICIVEQGKDKIIFPINKAKCISLLMFQVLNN